MAGTIIKTAATRTYPQRVKVVLLSNLNDHFDNRDCVAQLTGGKYDCGKRLKATARVYNDGIDSWRGSKTFEIRQIPLREARKILLQQKSGGSQQINKDRKRWIMREKDKGALGVELCHFEPSPVLNLIESSSVYPPNEYELTKFFIEQFKGDHRLLLIVSGHGDGTLLGDITFETLGNSLRKLAAKSNLTPDLLFLNSCFSSRLESLAQVSMAKVVVASEGMQSGFENWGNHWINQLFKSSQTPGTMGKALVEAQGDKLSVAINMEDLLILNQQFGCLVHNLLLRLSEPMFSPAVMKSIDYFKRHIAYDYSQMLDHVGDLGIFLSSLKTNQHSLNRLTRSCKKALKQAIIAKDLDPYTPSEISGISFSAKYWNLLNR